jgi:hypothetical protein
LWGLIERRHARRERYELERCGDRTGDRRNERTGDRRSERIV